MKKILILTSNGGGGHVAACQALTSYLSSSYIVENVNVFNEIIPPLDPLYFLTFGMCSAEKFYNYCMKKKYFSFLNRVLNLSEWYLKQRSTKLSNLLFAYLKEHKPDGVISIVPLVNGPTLIACEKLNVPFLLVPLDLNCKTFIYDIESPTYQKFKCCLVFDEPEIKKIFAQEKIPNQLIQLTGYPLRPDFFEKKDVAALKKKYAIDAHKPVLLILMGSQGSKALYLFTKELAKIKIPIHFIICAGLFSSIKEEIKEIQFPSHVTTSILDYTNKISDLMAMSDLFLTKSGSVSICEAIYMHLPMILDATNEPLSWEKFNHTFIKKHNFGTSIENYDNIATLVTHFLENRTYIEQCKKNLELFPKKNGGLEIKELIDHMLKL